MEGKNECNFPNYLDHKNNNYHTRRNFAFREGEICGIDNCLIINPDLFRLKIM